MNDRGVPEHARREVGRPQTIRMAFDEKLDATRADRAAERAVAVVAEKRGGFGRLTRLRANPLELLTELFRDRDSTGLEADGRRAEIAKPQLAHFAHLA